MIILIILIILFFFFSSYNIGQTGEVDTYDGPSMNSTTGKLEQSGKYIYLLLITPIPNIVSTCFYICDCMYYQVQLKDQSTNPAQQPEKEGDN